MNAPVPDRRAGAVARGARAPASGAPRYASQALAFLRYLAGEFFADRCPHAAAALAYTTLLALVPLLTVVFVTISAFPAFQSIAAQIQSFVFANFVPALGETVQSYMSEFARKASALRAVSLALLFMTVLALMDTVDGALNAIFHVRARRRRLLSVLVYCAVLTLGPLLVGTGLAVSSYLVSLPLVSDVDTSLGLRGKLLAALPLLSTFLAFVLLYTFVPNRPVPLRHAALGGAAAALLFELAKRGFALYVTRVPTYEAIYGAFAAIPVFLVWVYVSWLVVLFGAELTRCLDSFTAAAAEQAAATRSLFLDAYRVIARLAAAQRDGAALTEHEINAALPALGDRRLGDVLERLAAGHWIARTEGGGWVLVCDLDVVTLLDLYQLAPGHLVNATIPADDPAVRRLAAVLGRSQAQAEAAMRVPMRELVGGSAGIQAALQVDTAATAQHVRDSEGGKGRSEN